MAETGENKPTQEQLAVVGVLRQNLNTLLESKGVNRKRVLSKGGHIGVSLFFNEMGTSDIPKPLADFVNEQYFGRRVGIHTIELGYQYSDIDITVAHLYPSTEAEIAFARQRMVIPGEEAMGKPVTESAYQVEQRDKFVYFIFPDRSLVLSNVICITPLRAPLNSGITVYQLSEWLKREKSLTAKDRVEWQASTINRFVDPYRLGLVTEPPRTTPDATVLERPLDPKVILELASLIPGLPKGKQTRKAQSDFGSFEESVPQPRRQIIIR